MIKIALLSSFNADLLPSWLAAFLQESHIQADFYRSGFNQYRQQILDSSSAFYGAEPDVVILLLDSQDVFADLLQKPFDFLPGQRQTRVESELNNLAQYARLIRQRLPNSTLFLNTLVAPPATSLGLLEYNSPYSVRSAVALYNRGLAEVVRQTLHTYVVDCEALATEMGWRKWTDERLWLLGRMRLSREALELLARRYNSAIKAVHGTIKKVLVLDADNTLWGGTVGVDGVEGLQLGNEGIGLAYWQFQAEILNLYQRGVILALVSKNNTQDIDEVFERHSAMLLKREHFAALSINWQDKVTNLRQLAVQLNLGLDSFVFVDDNPFECAWVRDQLPEVQVLHLPSDPAEFVNSLRELDAFASLVITNEDLTRGQLYHEEHQRKTLQRSAASIEEFYASLEMHAIIRSVTPATLMRTAQLIQKTNQFNLTTRRYTENEVGALAEHSTSNVYTLSLSDRFGENGLVGVAILAWEGEIARIDTFLLSCRVMGRTVETAFLAFLVDCARTHGARYLVGEFLPTRKNMPVCDFYPQHGFAAFGTDDQRWRYDLQADSLRAPDYITLDLPREENNAQSTTC